MSGMWFAAFALLTLLSLANAFLLVAVMRQVGVLHDRLPPVGALEQEGPDVGRRLPRLELVATNDPVRAIAGADGTLVLGYVTPGCGACEGLVPVLERFSRNGGIEATVAFATDAPTGQARGFAREHKMTLPLLRHDRLSQEFGIKGSPYVLAVEVVDENEMVVLGGGVLHTLEQLEDVGEQIVRNKLALREGSLELPGDTLEQSTNGRTEVAHDRA